MAKTFAKLLDRKIETQPVPKEKWKETLMSAGFTENTSKNLMDMTQAVIDHIVVPENQEQVNKMPTTLEQYLKHSLE